MFILHTHSKLPTCILWVFLKKKKNISKRKRVNGLIGDSIYMYRGATRCVLLVEFANQLVSWYAATGILKKSCPRTTFYHLLQFAGLDLTPLETMTSYRRLHFIISVFLCSYFYSFSSSFVFILSTLAHKLRAITVCLRSVLCGCIAGRSPT